MVDQPSGKTLHGDKSHIFLFAFLHQSHLLVRRQIAQRILQSLVKPGYNDLFCNAKLMRRDSDVTDLSCRLQFLHTLIHSGTISRLVALIDTVELVDIHIVKLHIPKACRELLAHLFRRTCRCFCGNIHLLTLRTKAVERFADLFFAVAVGACRIKEPHPSFISATQDRCSILCADTLDRQCTKPILRHCDSRASQYDVSHILIPPHFGTKGSIKHSTLMPSFFKMSFIFHR